MIATRTGPFAWKGVDEVALQAALKRVFSSTAVSSKLQPLQMEWSLREFAAQCPDATRRDLAQRRRWAVSRGFRYVPLSAKCTKVMADRSPHALVEWALAEDENTSALQLASAVRMARVSLARS